MNAVWIVDDDRSIRWVLEKALTREEIPCRSFSSAADVLAALEEAGPPPRVLVSDIRMPGESGLSLLSKIKARFPHIPVIIMTAYSDLDSAVAAFQAGEQPAVPQRAPAARQFGEQAGVRAFLAGHASVAAFRLLVVLAAVDLLQRGGGADHPVRAEALGDDD